MVKWLSRSFVASGIAAAMIVQPLRLVRVTGISMEPTYRDGEFAVATQDVGDLLVGDVVIVRTPDGPIVQRVAKISGDGMLEVFLGGAWRSAQRSPRRGSKLQARIAPVPPGFVYVLGDNPDHSLDSRQFGLIAVKDIQSKLVAPKEIP